MMPSLFHTSLKFVTVALLCLPLRSLARSLKMSTGHFLHAPPCLA